MPNRPSHSSDDDEPLSPLGTITPTRLHKPDGQIPAFREPRTVEKFHLERSDSSYQLKPDDDRPSDDRTPLVAITSLELSDTSDDNQNSHGKSEVPTAVSVELSESDEDLAAASRARANSQVQFQRPELIKAPNPHHYSIITIPSERKVLDVTSSSAVSAVPTVPTPSHLSSSGNDTPKPHHRRQALSITLSDTSQLTGPAPANGTSPHLQWQRRIANEPTLPGAPKHRRGSSGSVTGATGAAAAAQPQRKPFYSENLSPADAIASPRQRSFSTRLAVKSGEGGGLLEKMILERQRSVSNLMERGKNRTTVHRSFPPASTLERQWSSRGLPPKFPSPNEQKPATSLKIKSASPGGDDPPRRGSISRSKPSRDPIPMIGYSASDEDEPHRRGSMSFRRASLTKPVVGVELSDDDAVLPASAKRQSISKRRKSVVSSTRRSSFSATRKRGSISSMDGGYMGTPPRRGSVASVDMNYPPTPVESADEAPDLGQHRAVRVSLSRSSVEPSRVRRSGSSMNYQGTPPGSGGEDDAPRLVCSSETDDGAAPQGWRGADLAQRLQQKRTTASESSSVSFASSGGSEKLKRRLKKPDLAERLAKAVSSLFKWALDDYSRHFLPNVLQRLENSSASVQRRAVKCIKNFVMKQRDEGIFLDHGLTSEDREIITTELDDVELQLYLILDNSARRINPNWQIPACDELFWHRFCLGEQVPIEILVEAVRAYDALKKGQMVWDEDTKKLFDRMLEVAIAPVDPCNVTWKEWTEFLLRFGPIEHCWEKASVLVNDGQKQRWFMPHSDKTAAEQQLRKDPNLHFVLRTSKTKRDEPFLVLSHNAGGSAMHGEVRNDQTLGYSMMRESTVIYLLSLSEYLTKLSVSMGWPKSALTKTSFVPPPAVTDPAVLLVAVAKAEAACHAARRLEHANVDPTEVPALLNHELAVGDPVCIMILRKEFAAPQPGPWLRELGNLLNRVSQKTIGIALRKGIAEETVKLPWQNLPLTLGSIDVCPFQDKEKESPHFPLSRSFSQMYPGSSPILESAPSLAVPGTTRQPSSAPPHSLQEVADAKASTWTSSLSEISSESSALLGKPEVATTPRPLQQFRKMFSFGGAASTSSTHIPTTTNSSTSNVAIAANNSSHTFASSNGPPSPTAAVPVITRSTPTNTGGSRMSMFSRNATFFNNTSPKRQVSTPRLPPGKSDRTLPDFPPPDAKSGSDTEAPRGSISADPVEEGILNQGEKRVIVMLEDLIGLQNPNHLFDVFCSAAKWGMVELVLTLLKHEKKSLRARIGSELKVDRDNKRRGSENSELNLLGNHLGQGNVLHLLASKEASVTRCLGDSHAGSQRLFIKRRTQVVAAILEEEQERRRASGLDESSPMLEARGMDDMTPLLRAAGDQNTVMVDILLSHGASIHASDKFQQSIFHFALDWRRCCIEYLFPKMLPAGPNILQAIKRDTQITKYHPINKRSTDSDGRFGRSPLIMALESDRADKGVIVNMLLDYGAVLTGNPRNVGRPELLKVLVDATNLGEQPEGAVNPGAVRGFVILQNAVDRGDVDLIELMLSCPVNLPRLPQYYIEYKDVSLLRMAVRNPGMRAREIFELLVVKQPEPSKKARWPHVRFEKTESPLRVFPPDIFYDTRLSLAAKIIRKREGAGAPPQKRASIFFHSHDRLTFPVTFPLHAANNARYLPQFRYHFSPYAFLNSGDGEGFTPLMHAIYNTNRTVSSQIIERLLQMDVDIHLVDSRERNALHHACLANNRLAVELLLQAHISTERRCIGNRTALHLAAEFGRWQILSALLRAGAKVDPWDEDGFTPLGRAMQRRKDLESPLIASFMTTHDTRYLEDQETVVETLLQSQSSIRAATKFHSTDELLDWRRDFVKIFMIADGQTLNTTRKRAGVATQGISSRFVGSDEDVSSEDENAFEPIQRKTIVTPAQLVQARIVEHNRQSVFQGKLNQVVINEAYEHEVAPRRGLVFVMYLMYLIVLSVVATFETSNDQKSAHWFYSALSTSLAGSNFTGIGGKEDFWNWAQHDVVNVFYPSTEYYYYQGTQVARNPEYILGHIRLLGKPRLRQLRTKPLPCKSLRGLAPSDDCFPQSGSNEEDTSHFTVPCNPDLTPTAPFANNTCLVFDWADGRDSNSTSYFGTLQTNAYPPGGYIERLPRRTASDSGMDEALQLLSRLETYDWVDTATRAVLFEFNVYNPTRNHFAKATFITEFSVSGKVSASFDLQVARFARYDSMTPWDIATAVFEVFFAIASFWTISRDVSKMRQSRLDYFSNVGVGYAVLAILMLLLFAFIFGLHIACTVEAARMGDAGAWGAAEWVDLGNMGKWWSIEIDLLSLLVLVSWIRLLEFASVWRGFAKLTVIVEMMLGEVMSFLVVVGVVLWSFAMSIYVSYGYKTETSYTLSLSLLARTFDILNGSTEDGSLYNRNLGPIYSVGYTVLLSVMLLNLLIAILTRAFDHATNDLGQAYWAQKQFVMVQQAMSSSSDSKLGLNKEFGKLAKKIELWIRSLQSYPVLWAQHAATHISKHFEDVYDFTVPMQLVRSQNWNDCLQEFMQRTVPQQKEQLKTRDVVGMNLLMHIAENCPAGNAEIPPDLLTFLDLVKELKDGETLEDTRHWQAKLLRSRDESGRTAYSIARARGCQKLVTYLEQWRQRVKKGEIGMPSFQEAPPPNFTSRMKSVIKRVQSSVPMRRRSSRSPTFARLESKASDTEGVGDALQRQPSDNVRIVIDSNHT